MEDNFYKFLSKIKSTLGGKQDSKKTIEQVLELCGRYLKADRIYIFELDEFGNEMSNTYEWCKKGIESRMSRYQNVSKEVTDVWMSELKQKGALYANANKNLCEDGLIDEAISTNGMESVLVVPMIDFDGNIAGFAGADNPRIEIEDMTMPRLLVAYLYGEILSLMQLENIRAEYGIVNSLVKSAMWSIDFDIQGQISDVFWSDEFKKMMGYEGEIALEDKNEAFLHFLHKNDRERVRQAFEGVLADTTGKEIYDLEYRSMTYTGEYRWLKSKGVVLRRANGSPRKFIGVFIDITEQKEYDELLQREMEYKKEMRHQFEVLTSLADIYMSMHIVDLEKDSCEEYGTSDFIQKYVNQSENAADQMVRVMTATVEEADVEAALQFTDLKTIAERIGSRKSFTKEFRSKEVGWFRARFIVVKRGKNGLPVNVLFTTECIDEEKKKEEHLILLSNIDGLTGLYNRYSYEQDLQKQEENLCDDVVLVSMDVNRLKYVNDNCGHDVGDEMLCGAANCMRMTLSDYGKVYRIGGDEFMAIIHLPMDKVEHIIKDFRKNVSKWRGIQVKDISVSCGYACAAEYPKASMNDLEKIADKNMYQDKREYYKSNQIDRRRN